MIPADIQLTQVQAGGANGDRREAGGDAWRSAWQKEMERLQASEWFGHGIVGAPASPEDKARPPPATAMPLREAQGVPAPAAVLARLAPSASQETTDTGGHDGSQAYAGTGFLERGGEVSADLGVNASADLEPNAEGLQAETAHFPQSPAHPAAIDVLLNHVLAAIPGMPAHANPGAPGTDAAVPAQRMAMPLAMVTAPSSGSSSLKAKVSEPLGLPSLKAEVAQQQSAERQGVRLHAEWTSESVRLWLGIDAGAAVPPAMLLQQLRRSVAALGMRLLSLTCNGALVPLNESPASAPTTEMEDLPWQSTQ